MSTTIREDSALEFDPQRVAQQWSVVIVHHRSIDVLGLRRVISKGSALDIGRACGAFGEGALDEAQLSRAHARLEVDARGALVVSDLGSANGTWVDGSRVGSATLRSGSIVRTGPVLFVAQWTAETYAIRRSTRAPAVSFDASEFARRLRARVSKNELTVLRARSRRAWSEHLALIAEELGRAVREASSLDEARAMPADHIVIVPGDSLTVRDRSSLRERAARPALVIDGAPRDAEDDDHTLAIAPLSERVEDIPWIARGALESAGAEGLAFDASYASRLLQACWPEDVEGVHRWAEAVSRRTGALTWSGEELALTGGPRPQHSADRAVPASAGRAETRMSIARDGSWFRPEGEPAVDLRMRFALAKILRALVAAFERDGDKTLSLDEVVHAGWPGEKLLSDSASNRVYVALATLRKLGLRDAIERREGGYRLSPKAAITVHSEEWPS